MEYYRESVKSVIKLLGSDKDFGLKEDKVRENKLKFGSNVLSKAKKKSFFSKLLESLKEPMLLILLFSFIIAFGISLGKFLKTGEGEFSECFGILGAIILSVSITMIMEGSSQKAFEALNKIYDDVKVKVIRNGEIVWIAQAEIVVGDVIFCESGDKIFADGRIIESNGLKIDESCLTGESVNITKTDKEINRPVPLAERKNCVYSGTFVTEGNCKYLVTAVGDKTEVGNIAGELKQKSEIDSPLQQKLAKLGKTVTLIGVCCAIFVFVLSLIKLIIANNVTFSGIQELFVSCIILIVAAVPEGLPTIVAVSLALNMIKLAKENALIKKMIATETAGAVSVICSDKTGTLTKNKMSVISVCKNEFCYSEGKIKNLALIQNFACNSTAIHLKSNKKEEFSGSGTECALLKAYLKSNPKTEIEIFRKKYKILDRIPFSSDKKYMITVIDNEGNKRELIKGAPEKVLPLCTLTIAQREKIQFSMKKEQSKAGRVICFAHKDGNENYEYDGYAVLADEIREEVFSAVKQCKKAGIKIKILTGDNKITAFAVAKQLKISENEKEVVSASEIEQLSDNDLKKLLTKITVIARSTPKIKARVVKLLKEQGEVVAVTGDGINDAPAIRHADVGIAMGKTGSEITKETADAILLDDSFATIVKAISFGRNVYRNLQRFIMFQLSVNITALLLIALTAILGKPLPFNTLQLLWINVIMDGPPALTLGLERASGDLMGCPPVKRQNSIVGKSMLLRIIFSGIFMATVLILQYLFNFLGAKEQEKSGAVFTLFIIFQLFNAFNARQLGSDSILKGIRKNKVMLVTFLAVFIVQVFIIEVIPFVFGVDRMSLILWIKTILTASSIIVVSEIGKFVYRTKFVYGK